MRQRRTFPEVLTCGNRAKRVCVYPPIQAAPPTATLSWHLPNSSAEKRVPLLEWSLLLRNERRRIPLCINAFRPVVPEHEIVDRCCCLVSVNAGQTQTLCAHRCAHTPQ